MKKLLYLALVVALLGIGVYAYLEIYSKDEDNTSLNTVEVVREDIQNIVTATGKLSPRDSVEVGAQVSGQLTKLHVDIGDKVVKGELLAEIDITLFMAKVDQQRAQLRFQQASLKEKIAREAYAKIIYEREKNLYENSATSLESFQNASLELQTAKAQVEMIKAQVAQIESSLRAEEANLEFTKIHAPMDGTVVSLVAKQGQTLNANQQAPTILEIADLSIMTLKAEISESDVMRLRPNMPVYFKTLGRDKKWHSNLSKIEPVPVVTNNVVLYNALFDVSNEEKELMTSMTAQVFFVTKSSDDALLIPVKALPKERLKSKARLQVLDGDEVREVEVELGVSNRIMIEVKSGLKEGERVIIPKKSFKKEKGSEKKMSRRRLV